MRKEDIVVYGKDGCPSCDDAKRWFAEQNQEIEYMTLGREYTKNFLLSKFPFVKSVPVVTIFGQYVQGGMGEVRNNWAQLSSLSNERCAEIAQAYEELENGAQ